MPVLTETLRDALRAGLFNVTLDKGWQVPAFQFFMGDLSGAIPAAEKYAPDDAFTAQCGWEGELKLSAFADNQVYVRTPLTCVLVHKTNRLLELAATVDFVVTLVAEESSLVFRVHKADVYALKWKSLEPTFAVKDEKLLEYYAAVVVNGLKGRQVLGTGWRTLSRKFPSVFIPSSEHIILFDSSEA